MQHFLLQGFICGVLAAVVLLGSCSKNEVVLSDLSQRDANIALIILRDNDIIAIKEAHTSKKKETYNILVKPKDVDKALKLLVYNHIPSYDRASLKDVYPPGGAGLLPTKSDETARLIMAMQGEIEELLKVLPGVADAKAVFSFEPPSDFQKSNVKKTAAVTLVFRPEESGIAPITENEVKDLIAKSISGLLAEDVIVVQKVIKPLTYLTIEKHKPQLSSTQNSSIWYFLVITAIALVIATYSGMRLWLQKRSLAR